MHAEPFSPVFLMRMLLQRSSQEQVNAFEDLTQDIYQASKLLHEYEYARWFGLETEGPFPSNLGSQMRHAMINVLCRRGRDFLEPLNAWRPAMWLTSDSESAGPKQCRDADHLLNVSKAIPLLQGIPARTIASCNTCGLVQNVPAAWTVNFTISPGRTAVLTVDPEPRFWEAVLLIKPQLTGSSQRYVWPGKDRFRSTFNVPEPVPFGPLEVGVILMSGQDLVVTAMRTHSELFDC